MLRKLELISLVAMATSALAVLTPGQTFPPVPADSPGAPLYGSEGVPVCTHMKGLTGEANSWLYVGACSLLSVDQTKFKTLFNITATLGVGQEQAVEAKAWDGDGLGWRIQVVYGDLKGNVTGYQPGSAWWPKAMELAILSLGTTEKPVEGVEMFSGGTAKLVPANEYRGLQYLTGMKFGEVMNPDRAALLDVGGKASKTPLVLMTKPKPLTTPNLNPDAVFSLISKSSDNIFTLWNPATGITETWNIDQLDGNIIAIGSLADYQDY